MQPQLEMKAHNEIWSEGFQILKLGDFKTYLNNKALT